MAPRGPGFLLAVLLTAVFGILAIGQASAAPPPFDPGGVMCFESLESSARCDGDTSPGAAADLRLTFCTGWNEDCSLRDSPFTDANLAGMVMFTPPEWTVPKGDTVPVGAIAGRVDEEEFLGLLNNPCNNRIQVSWTLLNASINVNDAIAPRPEGEADVMQPLAMDGNGNGIPDGADKYPQFLADFYAAGGTPVQPRARLFGITNIQGSWITENILFFEPGQTLEIGQTAVTFTPSLGYPSVAVRQDPTASGAAAAITDFCAPTYMDLVVLGKTLNNPCTPAAVQGANCPVTSDAPPEIKELGYPSFPCDPRSRFDDDGDGRINDGCPQFGPDVESGAQCENDTSDDTDGAVNDGCPPVGDVSEGARIPGICSAADEGGCTNRLNPGAGGTQTFTVLAVSERDADGDGIENGLDVCALIANPEWNPRGVDTEHDPDMDGLPSVCDPNPNETSPGSSAGCASGYTGPDEDQDCYSNRQDNCPLVNQLEDPSQPPGPANLPLQTDSDGDRIGDVCDPNPQTGNGEFIGYCLKFPLTVGGGAGPVVGVKDSRLAPDCAASSPCPVVPCGPVQPFTILTCSVNSPVFPPAPTPSEMTTATSDVTVYATVLTGMPLFGLSIPPVYPITFSDEPGLGAVDPTTVTVDTRGTASATYRLPADLTGQAVATVTATTASGKSCSVSFVIKPGPVVLPPTGGVPDGTVAGTLAALAGGAIALGGAAALVVALRRKRAAS